MNKQDWTVAPEGAQFYSAGCFRKHESGVEYFFDFGKWRGTTFDDLDLHGSQEDFEMRPTTQERTHPAAAHQYEQPAAVVEWPMTDSRMDAIGQNGGDGEHYRVEQPQWTVINLTKQKTQNEQRPCSQDLGQDEKVKNEMSSLYPKYYKDVSGIDSLDVYGVHDLFGIDDPSGCIQHASKKLLMSGVRTGGKSAYQDIKEARDTLNRKLQLMDQASENN